VGIDERAATQAAELTRSAERQVLGSRYELLGLLGSGGMGNVYRARDVELDELVALKVLLPQLVSAPGALDRFRREVKLARKVTHPNVARVFDIGEHGGDRILTMELVEGESLGARLHRDGRLPIRTAVEIARAICAGVGAAHAAGVVHRDLKPDNVLLEKTGRVVVTDFGIARAAAEGQRTAGIVGTPAYMAPEQIDERVTVDHRADQYALGAVLYEMLVGEPAWKGESLWALAAARLVEPPPDPRAKRPEIDLPLAAVVTRAMARAPEQRFASMGELDAALAAIVLPEASTSVTPLPASREQLALPTTGTDKRVAVLPFQAPPELDYVADGVTEDLIDALSVARGLRVRSRGAVMALKGRTSDAREIGRELDVQVVVEGSVRKAGASYRINARLVSVIDGFQLWARRFDVPESELLVQVDQIAAALAEALSVELAAPTRSASDAAAVDLYLRAKRAYHRSFSQDMREALALYEELVALTPDDPKALAGYVMASTHQWAWFPGTKEKLLAASDRAVALAPTMPDGHVARALFHLFAGESLQAIAPLKRALRISRASADAQEAIGRVLLTCDSADGLPHADAALALEPTAEFNYITSSCWFELRGDRERAEQLLARADALGLTVSGRMWPRIALFRGDRALAAALLEKIVPGSFEEKVAAPWLLATLGTPPPPMVPPPTPPGAIVPMFLQWFLLESMVEIACVLGDLPRALAGLVQLDAMGCHDLLWLEHAAPLAPLRGLPEAQAARRGMHARAEAILAAYRARD
jgi:serine/threonine-protein kinase